MMKAYNKKIIILAACTLFYCHSVFGQQNGLANGPNSVSSKGQNNIVNVGNENKSHKLPYSQGITGAIGAIFGGVITYIVGRRQRIVEARGLARKRIIRRLMQLYVLHQIVLDDVPEDIKITARHQIPRIAFDAVEDLLDAKWSGCTELLWGTAMGHDLGEFARTQDLIWQMLESTLKECNPAFLKTLRNANNREKKIDEILLKLKNLKIDS